MEDRTEEYRTEQERVRIGVSSCLLGNSVRFDGGHKRNRFITDELAQHFEFVSYCPELAIGMSVPRQPIRQRITAITSTSRVLTIYLLK